MAIERMSRHVESKEREPRFEIVRLWRERQIKWKAMNNSGRLIPEKADVDRYASRRKEQRAGFGSEAVGMAEAMVQELLDHEGVTKPYKRTTRAGKVKYDGYDMLASEGIVYPASDLDDQLRGADMILLVADPEQGSEAKAFAIDVTVDRNAITNKIATDLYRVRESGENLNLVYWYDTMAGEPGENFVDPMEGKIPAVNLSVYVPSEMANKYMSEKTESADARAVMERLGPFVLRQMRNELEILGMRAAGYLRSGQGRDNFVRYPSVPELIGALKDLERSGRGLSAPKSIRIALENILSAEEENLDRGFVLNPRDEDQIPEIIPGFKGLPSQTAEAAE